ncbi:hypothetical protein APB26_32835 [Pseudomonas aeruginosa]|uniref:hypothetical protein n=1 Tax=Pseudomonas aeruginosa TaxID=287 RepID=UPI00071B38CC|nr:hypothetical protein [Pseudomonas aeruginosa]KSQ21767.1 hypothetical protein APB26_32835 [Pseudomonas aeruginosa]RPV61441.1 hypothetical protein IPC838_19180 [Pseudomonas aeruginosa]
MHAWIAHQRYIRRFNAVAVALLGLGLALAYAVGRPQAAGVLLVVEVVGGGLLIGMANVVLLLDTPRVNATDDEIRAAAATGPRWLKRLVAKLDA